MPIEIQCVHCKRKLRVADKFAGKRAKCPGCQEPIDIPALGEAAGDAPEAAESKATAAQSGKSSIPAAKADKEASKSSAPQKPVATKPVSQPAAKPAAKSAAKAEVAKDEWYMKTDDGEEYGPVTKTEMDAWVEDGRVDASCQLLREGWEQWKWAEEVYTDLAAESPEEEAAADENPSASEDAGGGFDLEALTGGDAHNSTAESSVAEDDDPLAGIGYDAPSSRTSKTPAKSSSSSRTTKASRTKSSKPKPEEEPESEEEAGVGLSPRAKQALAGTQPWVKFFGILLFLGAGMMGIGAIMVLILALASFGASAALGAVFLLAALVYFAAAGGYGYAGYCLFKYGSHIQKYLARGKPSDLDAALVAQQAFWKFLGIITALAMGVMVLMVLASSVLGGAATMVGTGK